MYTEQTGLPFYDRASGTANGYCGTIHSPSALESMREKSCFRYRSVNIGPSYK